jgi:transporter family protein
MAAVPIVLALISLCCATANDLVYRRRARDADGEAGRHLLLVAMVWTMVFLAPAMLAGPVGAAALLWGAVSGAAGVGAHLLLLAALRTGDLGTCSTIYRLNLIPAALVAVLLLGEQLTPLKAVAIAVAAGAVGLLAGGGQASSPRAIRLALGACLLRAAMALGYKQGLLAGAEPMHLLAINGVAWSLGALLWLGLARPRAAAAPWSRPALGWGLASGLLVSGNVLFLTLALARAPLTTVLPITQLSFVATAALACLVGGEPVLARRVAGIGMAAAAVVLMAFT